MNKSYKLLIKCTPSPSRKLNVGFQVSATLGDVPFHPPPPQNSRVDFLGSRWHLTWVMYSSLPPHPTPESCPGPCQGQVRSRYLDGWLRFDHDSSGFNSDGWLPTDSCAICPTAFLLALWCFICKIRILHWPRDILFCRKVQGGKWIKYSYILKYPVFRAEF